MPSDVLCLRQVSLTFVDVFENGDDGVVGQSGLEKDGAVAFGKGLFAMGTIQ